MPNAAKVTGAMPDLGTDVTVELRFVIGKEGARVECLGGHPVEPEMENVAYHYWLRETGTPVGVHCLQTRIHGHRAVQGCYPEAPPDGMRYVKVPLWVLLGWLRRSG